MIQIYQILILLLFNSSLFIESKNFAFLGDSVLRLCLQKLHVELTYNDGYIRDGVYGDDRLVWMENHGPLETNYDPFNKRTNKYHKIKFDFCVFDLEPHLFHKATIPFYNSNKLGTIQNEFLKLKLFQCNILIPIFPLPNENYNPEYKEFQTLSENLELKALIELELDRNFTKTFLGTTKSKKKSSILTDITPSWIIRSEALLYQMSLNYEGYYNETMHMRIHDLYDDRIHFSDKGCNILMDYILEEFNPFNKNNNNE